MAHCYLYTLAVTMAIFTTSNASYTLRNTYSGPSFFTNTTFYSGTDPAAGTVSYVSHATALEQQYIGLTNTSHSDHAIYIGVEQSATASNSTGGRQSIRLSTIQSWTHGLFVLDVQHAPTGCGTWPSIWMLDTANPVWPGNTGEIDILESVNVDTFNSMTLHTSSGCEVQNQSSVASTEKDTSSSSSLSSSSSFEGTLQTDNCYVDAPSQSQNAGCGISATTSSTTSNIGSTAGSGFNSAGGGVFALEWTSSYLSVYFFPRDGSNASSSVLLPTTTTTGSQTLDPTTFPAANRLAHFVGCDFDAHLANLSLVVDTDFCGGWAESQWDTSGCAASTGVASCADYVTGSTSTSTSSGTGSGTGAGGDWSEAYWLLGSMSVYQED